MLAVRLLVPSPAATPAAAAAATSSTTGTPEVGTTATSPPPRPASGWATAYLRVGDVRLVRSRRERSGSERPLRESNGQASTSTTRK
jgi:hypothetical protein